jgi:hypothetical protein
LCASIHFPLVLWKCYHVQTPCCIYYVEVLSCADTMLCILCGSAIMCRHHVVYTMWKCYHVQTPSFTDISEVCSAFMFVV